MIPSRDTVRLAGLKAAAPAVARLGWLRRGRSPWGPPPSNESPRVLLIRPDHLGDLLLASPAAALLRETLPGSQIDWLVGPWVAEMARRAGATDGQGEVRTLEFPGFTRQPKHSSLEPYEVLWREATGLRAERYDAALILRPDHWWGALLASLAGIPRRFGYAVAECAPFLTDTLPTPTGPHRHAVRSNQALARLAGSRLSGCPPVRSLIDPEFPTSAEERSWARTWLAEHLQAAPTALDAATRGHGGSAGTWTRSEPPIIAVHPGAGAPLKQWLPEKWANVARAMRERFDARIFLTGGPGEHELVEQIATRLDPRPPTVVGSTSIGQLAALFEACDLVFGCDSGPLHLAAAVHTMTVRLYGPTDENEFGPWSADRDRWSVGHWSVRIGNACPLSIEPCGFLANPPCGHAENPPCMTEIVPDAVASAAIELLTYDGGHDDTDFKARSLMPAQSAGEPAC